MKIEHLCEAVELHRSSYYAGLNSIEKNYVKDYALWQKILEHWERFPGHGPRKIWKYLVGVNHKRIDRVIRRFLGHSVSPRKKLVQPTNTHSKLTNVLKCITKALLESETKLIRGNWILKEGKNRYQKVLEATKPFQLWTGDWKEVTIPYVNLKVYVFIIIDTYTKLIVGWHIGMSKIDDMALTAAQMAMDTYMNDTLFNGRSLIHHTDRGSSYTSDAYRSYWRAFGVKLSYSDPGKPTQNGYSEGYMSLLARFFLRYYDFESYGELKEEFGKFIELYNSEWKHGKIRYRTPIEMLEYHRNFLT